MEVQAKRDLIYIEKEVAREREQAGEDDRNAEAREAADRPSPPLTEEEQATNDLFYNAHDIDYDDHHLDYDDDSKG